MNAKKSFTVTFNEEEKKNIALAKNTMISIMKTLDYHKDLEPFINKVYQGVQALEMLQNGVITLGVYPEDFDNQFHEYNRLKYNHLN